MLRLWNIFLKKIWKADGKEGTHLAETIYGWLTPGTSLTGWPESLACFVGRVPCRTFSRWECIPPGMKYQDPDLSCPPFCHLSPYWVIFKYFYSLIQKSLAGGKTPINFHRLLLRPLASNNNATSIWKIFSLAYYLTSSSEWELKTAVLS